MCNGIVGYLTYRYYPILQGSVNKLTFSLNKTSFVIAVLISGSCFVAYFLTIKFIKNRELLKRVLLVITTFVFAISWSFIYIKIDKDEELLHKQYDDMNYLYSKEYESGYHFKNDTGTLMENFGYVSNKSTQDFFTSLTNNDMFTLYQKLGYDSYARNTSSNGSNIFMDGVLANKYLVTSAYQDKSLYKLVDSNNGISVYSLEMDVSKGYFIKDIKSLDNVKNSFEASNVIYKSITGKDENIFNIINTFDMVNVEYKDNTLRIIDDEKEAYIKKSVDIGEKQILYFEFSKPFINKMNNKSYSAFDIYINDKLVFRDYLSKENTGCINLGTFEKQKLNIKIVVKKKEIPNINGINLGLVSIKKVNQFFKDNKTNIDLDINKNSINIKYDSKEEGILFIPVGYINGMHASNNNKKVDIVKVFDNFIGIRLESGVNDISIGYSQPGIIVGLIISVLGIISSILFLKFKNNISRSNIIKNISYYTYLGIYIVAFIIFYIVPAIMFMVSFI